MTQLLNASPDGVIELFHVYIHTLKYQLLLPCLAVQDIFEKEDIFNRAKNMSSYFLDGLFSLKDITVH